MKYFIAHIKSTRFSYTFFFIIWALSTTIAICLDRNDWWRYSLALKQSLAVLFFYILIAGSFTYFNSLFQKSAIYTLMFGFMLTIFTTSYFISNQPATYPFLTWGMYAKPFQDIIYYTFVSKDQSGKRIELELINTSMLWPPHLDYMDRFRLFVVNYLERKLKMIRKRHNKLSF